MTLAFAIRDMGPDDRSVWCGMYRAIYPDETDAALLAEIDRILAAPNRAGIIAEREGETLGFAEFALRDYANGCHSKPVPFLEGIWVAPDHRETGVAKALVRHLEDRARAAGYREMGSDVLLGNQPSLDFHHRLGFEETERVVFLRKDLE